MSPKRKSKPKHSIKKTLIWVVIFGTFWTTITGVFDVIVYRNIRNQERAQSFPTTNGKIVSSKVESERDSDGTTYRAAIIFEYEVNGQAFESDTWRFGEFGMSNSTEATRIVAEYPTGTDVTVYYDPTSPAVAILEPGVKGTDMFMLIFLTPFNLIGLGCWALFLQILRVQILKPPAGGLSIRRPRAHPHCVHVRLPRISPLVAAALGGALVCFFSIFIAAFLMAMAPPMWFIRTVWLTALGVTAIIYIWRSIVVGSGVKDLVIDFENQVLDLPQTLGREKPTLVPFDALQDVILKREVSYSSNGQSETWVPTLKIKPGYDFNDDIDPKDRTRITEFAFAFKAQGLVDWLRTELKIDT